MSKSTRFLYSNQNDTRDVAETATFTLQRLFVNHRDPENEMKKKKSEGQNNVR